MIQVLPKEIPFFSVIICTYNRASIIEGAIQSLLAQSEHDWEAIIVDDGSTDDTFSVVQPYCNSDKRIRYCYHSNKGVGLSKNTGILAASGMFVTFLDSDDQYKEDHLQSRKEMLIAYPDLEMLHGGCEVNGDTFVADKNDPTKKISLDQCVIGGTFFIKRSTLIDMGGFSSLRYGDDADFYDRAVEKGIYIAHTDYPSYIYNRDSEDSLCTNQFIG